VKNSNPPKPTRKRNSNAEAKVLRLLQDIETCHAENLEANLTTVPNLNSAHVKLKEQLHKQKLVKLDDSDNELFNMEKFFQFCIDRAEERVGAKSNSITRDTHSKWKNVARIATEYFSGEGVTDLREITVDHANAYRDHRLTIRASSTVQSEIKYLRHVFFEKAIDRRLLHANPFRKTKVIVKKSEIEDRRFVVNPIILEQVDSVITNFNWRLYWNLVRWTGSRASEPLKLKWKAVSFEDGRLIMPAPKTEKMGVPQRKMPLYDELLPILEEAFNRQNKPSPESYVVQDICNLPKSNREDKSRPAKNCGTDIKRFIKQAEVTPWPKPLQNLRVTREDELLKSGEYSTQAVHAFIGHSNQTYLKNYQASLTDEDFVPVSKRQNTDSEILEPAP
tara:strand:- start:580 stop:1755 length:1176 start_codon:yes stop_codon:yes gene_type:complete